MLTLIKTIDEINNMRKAGSFLCNLHNELKQIIRPGISTLYINNFAEKIIYKMGCIPNFLNYNNYPASICVSINNEVVHGIPKNNKIIQDNDVVSLDAGLIYNGYHSDAARTYIMCNKKTSKDIKNLVKVTKQSFFEGIKYAKPNKHLYDISFAIDKYISKFGYGIVKDLVGHGIGRNMHEAPQIPNFKQKYKGMKLKKGMTLAIEPMINLGKSEIIMSNDNWTILTKDNSISAHYENTILITDNKPEILTINNDK